MPHSLQLAWQAIREKGKLPARPLPSPTPPPLATHLSQISGTSLEQSVEIPVLIGAVADPGEGPWHPPLFLDQTVARRAQKIFLLLAPLYLRVWMTAPLPYLKVWIRHCGGGVYITSVFYYTLEQGLFLPAILLK